MTLKEFLQKTKALPSEEAREFVLETADIWSNEACLGYVVEAMKIMEMSDSEIEALTDCISSVFEDKSVAEAETVWNEWYK